MVIIQNVLSSHTLDVLKNDLESKVNEQVWKTSSIWDAGLTDGGAPSCSLHTIRDEDIRELIIKDIIEHLPPFHNLNINYYIWGRGSLINSHDDGGLERRKFAATVYLNSQWNVDDGGLFVWEETEDDWKVYVPKPNSMVINNAYQKHLVTPISMTTPRFRTTLQIWGETYETI